MPPEAPSLISAAELQQIRWRLSLYERVNRELRERALAPWRDRLLPLAKFERVHAGRRCFVVGNGPSLNQIDMGRLRDEITFGSNRIYLGFDRWGFAFNYWAVQDETQIRQSAGEYVERVPAKTVKFIPTAFLHLFDLDRFAPTCPVPLELHPVPYPQFSASKAIQYNGWTVTYLLLQLAVIMGCNPIILVGVDHSYNIGAKELVAPNRWKDQNSNTHFDPGYAAPTPDHLWNAPNYEFMDAAFACAAQWSARSGVKILNATPGSKLEAFEKIEFGTLFA